MFRPVSRASLLRLSALQILSRSPNVRMRERYVYTAIILNDILVPFITINNGEAKSIATTQRGTTIYRCVAIVHDLVITKVTSVMRTELISSCFVRTYVQEYCGLFSPTIYSYKGNAEKKCLVKDCVIKKNISSV